MAKTTPFPHAHVAKGSLLNFPPKMGKRETAAVDRGTECVCVWIPRSVDKVFRFGQRKNKIKQKRLKVLLFWLQLFASECLLGSQVK